MPFFVLDINGHIASWNKGAEKIKGYKEQGGDRKAHVYFLSQKMISKRKFRRKNLQSAKRLGQFEDEGWRVRKDGSLFWASVTFTALRDKNGNLTGFGKLTRDISRRRQNEDEIQRLNRQLENQVTTKPDRRYWIINTHWMNRLLWLLPIRKASLRT
jgi:PAS domain S-box-containing protein